MTEDQLLKDLGDLARQEDEAERTRLDERWDRLAAGTLSAAEEAELEALAARSEDAREALEAFRPLGAGFQARAVAAATAELTGGSAPEPAERGGAARLLPFHRAAKRLPVWFGAAAAAAAALFFVLRNPAVPLPLYTASLTGGAQSQRGEPAPSSGPPVFLPGSLLTLTASPQSPVAGAVEARGFLSRLLGAADLRPLEPQPRFEIRNGTVRLRATLGRELRIPPGAWRIWIVVGRPGKMPSSDDLAGKLPAGENRQGAWQAVSADLLVADRAAP
jgi:hypothetical protein